MARARGMRFISDLQQRYGGWMGSTLGAKSRTTPGQRVKVSGVTGARVENEIADRARFGRAGERVALERKRSRGSCRNARREGAAGEVHAPLLACAPWPSPLPPHAPP